MWTSLALTEIALLTATIWVGVYAYQRWGPGPMRGMATSAEAEKLLGITRLRKVAGIVRPDLYGKHTPAPEPVHRTAGDATDRPGPALGPSPAGAQPLAARPPADEGGAMKLREAGVRPLGRRLAHRRRPRAPRR